MCLINFRKSFITSGLLKNMTDIHSHILFGVDDGIKCYEDTVISLRWLKSYGISRILLTPHIMSDFPENTTIFLSKSFDLLKKRLEYDGVKDIPELRLGAEYMIESTIEKHKNDGFITYKDRYILVETSYMTPPMGFIGILEKLMEDGYSPVLAHPERYIYMDKNDYIFLKTMGMKFQLNYLSIIGTYGKMAKNKAIRMLNDSYYDYAGSDFHDLSRHREDFFSKCLKRKHIEKLQQLFDNNKELWQD